MLIVNLTSCGNDDDFPSITKPDTSENTDGGNDGDNNDKEDEVLDDNIVINETPLAAEKESVPMVETEGYKDFVENFKYDDEEKTWDGTEDWTEGVKVMEIEFSDNKVSYEYYNKKGNSKPVSAEDFDIETDGAHITIHAYTKCHYKLSGKTANGSIKIYSDKKFILSLEGADITNPKGAAINIQKGVDGGKRCFLVIADGTKNYLHDGATYADAPEGEQEKGVIFSEGKICISGKGYLNISGNGKNGIASDDYVYLHAGPQITITPAPGHDGIKTNDGITIAGGVVNITCNGSAAKGINTEGAVSISGGRTTIINTSTKVAEGDSYSMPYCIKTNATATMTNGTLLLSASKEDGNGIRADMGTTISGGTVTMVIKEKAFTGQVSAAEGSVILNGKKSHDISTSTN